MRMPIGRPQLNHYDDRIKIIKQKMHGARIGVKELHRALSIPLSYNNLLNKLRGFTGMHETEIDHIERVVSMLEQNIKSELLG